MVCVPVPAPDGVYVTEQLDVDVAPIWASAHDVALKVPLAPLLPSVTLPCGQDFVPLSVSLTVVVQVVL
jgi:hypothetical protein